LRAAPPWAMARAALLAALVSAERSGAFLSSGARWLPGAFKSSGLLLLAVPRLGAQVQMVIDTMDTNKDGVVDREEFLLASRDALDAQQALPVDRSTVYRYAESLYDACDIDGDGMLSSPELSFGQLLTYTAGSHLRGPAEAAKHDFGLRVSQQMLSELDKNNDAKVSKDEFYVRARQILDDQGWSPLIVEDPRFRVRIDELFAEADVTNDGFLNARELQFADILLTRVVVAEAAGAILKTLDSNSDGIVDMAEVEAILAKSPGGLLEAIAFHFHKVDSDQDGLLDRKEVGAFLWRLEWFGPYA